MSASANDKITDVRNAARPVSTTVSSPRSSGGNSLACNALTGWPTASKVHFVTYQIDSNSNPIAGTQLDCSGIVSGNTIGSFTVIDGTDNGNSIGDVVEMLPTAAWGQDLADALTSTHNRSGGLKSAITLTLPTIADFTNANHNHSNAAGGGTLGFTSLLATIFSGQVLTYVNTGTGAGTGFYVNLGGIKLVWGVSASAVTISGSNFQVTSFTVSYPTAFFSTIQYGNVSTGNIGASNFLNVSPAATATTTGQAAQLVQSSGTNGTSTYYWFAIGT